MNIYAPFTIKENVKPLGLRPEMMLAILAASAVYHRHKQKFTITSISDGEHGAKSKHLIGSAVDIRTRDLTGDMLDIIIKEIRDALTNDYDVIPEKTHLHIEWDPK